MRISELSQESGLPIATIKFYLREGLLPPGERTARNQAAYGKDHLSRLHLISALTVVGRLPLSAVREIVTALEDRGTQLDGLCQVINKALIPLDHQDQAGPIGTDARAQVNAFVDGLDWNVEPGSPGRSTLAREARGSGSRHRLDRQRRRPSGADARGPDRALRGRLVHSPPDGA
jgi:DNA-binding transcriptional MerR regulator